MDVDKALVKQDEALLYVETPLGMMIHCPAAYERAEVLDLVDSIIRPQDRYEAVVTPLAWRVGFTIGWLSALHTVQANQAREGLFVLSALVQPLLIHPS
jgi:hypothetical protein